MPTEGVVRLGEPQWVEHPVVHGTLRDGSPVTLFAVGGVNPEGPFSASREIWRPQMVLNGVHAVEDSFDRVTFQFDCLVPWTEPPPVVRDVPGNGSVLDLSRTTLESASLGESEVLLRASWTGQSGGDSVQVERRVSFNVSTNLAPVGELVDGWVRPLQDLLILVMGRSVRLTHLNVRREEQEQPNTAEVFFAAVQPDAGQTPSWSSIMSYTSPTLLTRCDSPLPFQELLKSWFTLREELRDAITLLCSPYYAPFMYSEHRYSSVFQSAEALARAQFAGRQKSREEHKSRVRLMVDAATAAGLGEADIDWATRVLQSRNDKTLAEYIQELVESTGRVGEAILATDPDFARRASSERTGVSHPGANREDALSLEERYWYGQALLWVVRASLLIRLGLEPGLVSERITRRGPFMRMLDALREGSA